MNTDKRSRDLTRAFPGDPDRLSLLHDRLASRRGPAKPHPGHRLSRHPLPVVLPCHRVVHSHGSLGGYLGGADAKRTLLTPEAAA